MDVLVFLIFSMKATVVHEITYYLSNQAGELSEVTKMLSDEGVSIRGLLVSEGFGKSVIRMVVKDEEKAVKMLAGHGVDDVSLDQILEVTLPSRKGVIADLSARLSKANINIENIYVTESSADETLCYVSVSDDDVEEAVRLLDA